jgi:hypothetical protein
VHWQGMKGIHQIELSKMFTGGAKAHLNTYLYEPILKIDFSRVFGFHKRRRGRRGLQALTAPSR